MDLNRRTLLETVGGLLAASQVLQAAGVQSVLLDSRHARLEEHPFGKQHIYFEGSTAGLKSLVVGSLVLNPGQEPHPPHTHPDEEVMVITEGSGEITMNGAASDVDPGGVMYAAPNYLHGVRNTGSTPLTFYYVKWVAKAS
jgi:mannose-6-phosphate isomerase-like protein (cupin superfamily)